MTRMFLYFFISDNFMESNAPLREAILAHSKMSEEELSQRLMLKQQELHGLLSQDGALHIIANEMGINVKQFFARPTPIASLVSGMHVFGVQGSVSRIYPVQSFDKNGKRGIVGSFLLQDPTGSIRVVAWNDQVSSLSSLHEGDTVLLQHAQVKQRQNTIEIHLLPETALKVSATIIRKLLCQINESDKMVQVHGTIVAVHELRFFEQCPRCKKRLLPQNQQWICATDGIQPPKYGYLLSLIIDDGSETRRAIFFFSSG